MCVGSLATFANLISISSSLVCRHEGGLLFKSNHFAVLPLPAVKVLFLLKGRSLYDELFPVDGSRRFRFKYRAVRNRRVPAPSDNANKAVICNNRDERNMFQITSQLTCHLTHTVKVKELFPQENKFPFLNYW